MNDSELTRIWRRMVLHFSSICLANDMEFHCLKPEWVTSANSGYDRIALVFEVRTDGNKSWGALNVWPIRDNGDWATIEEFQLIDDTPYEVQNRSVFEAEKPLNEKQDILDWLNNSLSKDPSIRSE